MTDMTWYLREWKSRKNKNLSVRQKEAVTQNVYREEYYSQLPICIFMCDGFFFVGN